MLNEKNISVSFDHSRGEGGTLAEIQQDWNIAASVDSDGYLTLTGNPEDVKAFLEDYGLEHLFDWEDPAYEDMEAIHYVSNIKEEL
jgi:hypothetical protein